MNKLTPREPTPEMVDAGWKTFASNATLSGHARVALAWRAMHDAAPSVPSVEQELLEALDALAKEFVAVFPIYYYAEPWAHDTNEKLKNAQRLIARAKGK